MAVLGQKREHATSRNQLPNHRLGVQQLPLGTRRTLHSKIIPANQAPSRQTRRPPTDLFSGVLADDTPPVGQRVGQAAWPPSCLLIGLRRRDVPLSATDDPQLEQG